MLCDVLGHRKPAASSAWSRLR